LHYWVAFTIATSFFVVLTLIALGRLDFIRGRWLVTAGALTYPLYLLHQQIGETVIRSLDRHVEPWLLLALVFAGIVGLSYLMNRYAERPLAGLAKRLLTRRAAPPRSDPVG
ncbi:MAG TPA: acyltransferase, partial [Micromonosporaceae bacterium]